MHLRKINKSYLFITLLAVILLTLLYLNTLRYTNNMLELVKIQNKNSLDTSISSLQQFFDDKIHDLNVLSNIVATGKENPGYYLDQELKSGQEYMYINYINTDGVIINRAPYDRSIIGKNINISSHKVFLEYIEKSRQTKKSQITKVYKHGKQDLIVSVISPVIDPKTDKVKGYICAALKTGIIGKEFIYNQVTGTGNSIFGVDSDGMRVFSSIPGYVSKNVGDESVRKLTDVSKKNYMNMSKGVEFSGEHDGYIKTKKMGKEYNTLIKKNIISKPVFLNGEFRFSLAVTTPINGTALIEKYIINQLAISLPIFLIVGYLFYRIIRGYKEKQDLERSLEESEAADKLKTEFFCNMSHELRTPLTIILNGLHFILRKYEANIEQDNELKKMFLKIRQNGYRLLKLVNNLLEISRFESGFALKEFKNLDVVKIVEDIAMSVVYYAQQKNIELRFDTDFEEKVVAIDEDGIERVVMNLLSNALKFTPVGGKVMIKVSENDEYLKISVKDDGIGIPEDKKHLIFERFTQVDSSLRRSAEGSGIGLAIVKSIVELHDGKIEVFSENGKGAEFIVYIPNKIVTGKEVSKGKKLDQEIVNNINIEFSDI